jgi:hypothetical protein
MLLFAALFFFANGYPCSGQKIQRENIPEEIVSSLVAPDFYLKYDIDPARNPFYLRGDFNGDGKPDYAVWIKTEKSGQSGIAIWLSSTNRFEILGAGHPFSFGGAPSADFKDITVWRVQGKSLPQPEAGAPLPPSLVGDAIRITRNGTGILYWTGKTFHWYELEE